MLEYFLLKSFIFRQICGCGFLGKCSSSSISMPCSLSLFEQETRPFCLTPEAITFHLTSHLSLLASPPLLPSLPPSLSLSLTPSLPPPPSDDDVADYNVEREAMQVIWSFGQVYPDYFHFPNSGIEVGTFRIDRFYQPDELKYHGTRNRGATTINFFGEFCMPFVCQ